MREDSCRRRGAPLGDPGESRSSQKIVPSPLFFAEPSFYHGPRGTSRVRLGKVRLLWYRAEPPERFGIDPVVLCNAVG